MYFDNKEINDIFNMCVHLHTDNTRDWRKWYNLFYLTMKEYPNRIDLSYKIEEKVKEEKITRVSDDDIVDIVNCYESIYEFCRYINEEKEEISFYKNN